jgi:serine/threonine-protein kinase
VSQSAARERYRILRLIGRGAWGQVYSARDVWLERNVALKVLRNFGVSQDVFGLEPAEAIARLMREARAIAALEHPNIVAIYDVGELPFGEGQEPSCFIAMELVEGLPLRRYIGRADVPLETRISWLSGIARALAYAHERGVVHRDIKPDNVMIRDDGAVKVLDFGLARRALGVEPGTGSVAFPTLTKEGNVVGTPLYMAPEQMEGTNLDGRADQYSWGVTAFELLSGQLPWPVGRDSIQVVARVLLQRPLLLGMVEPRVPARLAEVVRRAMARDRAERFESMRAVLEATEAALATDVPSVATAAGEGTPNELHAPPALESRVVPVDAAPSSRETLVRQPPERWSRPGRWIAMASIGAGLAAAAVLVPLALRRGQGVDGAAAGAGGGPCTATANCPAGQSCVGGRCAARPDACRSSSECTRRLGTPAVCRPDTAECIRIVSEDCHAVAEEADLQNDATVWFGAMFPLVGEEAESFGKPEFQAVDMARSEFASMLRGMHAGTQGGHPLAIVACDDSVDPARAARHLVDDVRVPAVIGFRTSQEVIDLATSMFIPRGVLAIAALNTSPIITHLPHPRGEPRMVFRTTYSSAATVAPVAMLISDVLEPEIRGLPRALRRGDALRVALVRQDDPAGVGFADAFFRALRFNGRSALENGENYREFAYPYDGNRQPNFEQVTEGLLSFAPHVIVHFGVDAALLRMTEPLERRWSQSAWRPRYVRPIGPNPALLAFAGQSAERRHRFFWITSTSMTQANARFVTRYSDVYPGFTRTYSPSESYDAFYLLAYTTYALGQEPVTGRSLARMIARLLPPGPLIDVGPNEIFDGLNALAAGAHIDLNGATGPLDFDLDTGEAKIDFAIVCARAEPDGGAADSIESGLIYDATAGTLRGTMHCP